MLVLTTKQHERSARRCHEPGWRKLAEVGSGKKNDESFDAAIAVMPERRAIRTDWGIATAPYKDSHFATFPPELTGAPSHCGGSDLGTSC